MNTKAIVTILLGETYISYWKKFCENNWKLYAEKYGYDIVVIDYALDTSERAINRSPSWQRCLIFKEEKVQKYDRIVWIDADVIINYKNAPCVFEGVPPEKIGGIDAYCFHTPEIYNEIYTRFISIWKQQNSKAIVNATPAQYYKNWGLPEGSDAVIECGVLVLNKRYHKDLLEGVYANYEDKGGSEWNYEMRPLSYQIVKNNLHHFIDTRFNYIYPNFIALNYPYLFSTYWKNRVHRKLFRIMDKMLGNKVPSMDMLAANTAFINSYFLHFAGGASAISYVDTTILQNDKTIRVRNGFVKI